MAAELRQAPRLRTPNVRGVEAFLQRGLWMEIYPYVRIGISLMTYWLKIVKMTGSMKTLCIEVRVKINHVIVVGANCLSSSLIKSSEWWRCQLSRTITQDCEEDWKHEDIVYGSKGQNHPLNSSWCKLPEFISYKELWMMKVPAVKNYYSRLWIRLEEWRHCVWKIRVKITHLIVVGANCLSSSLIKSFEWWRCQLSRTITQDCE